MPFRVECKYLCHWDEWNVVCDMFMPLFQFYPHLIYTYWPNIEQNIKPIIQVFMKQ